LEWEQHIDVEIVIPKQPDELGLCKILEFHGQFTNTTCDRFNITCEDVTLLWALDSETQVPSVNLGVHLSERYSDHVVGDVGSDCVRTSIDGISQSTT
jgi:hypothetical protein